MPGAVAPRRFRVAFSFAGEKREFVAKVARLLADRFGEAAILYDKFHEAEFARDDLGMYLPTLYGERSDLIVPVLCPEYDEKRWTGWEWLRIYGLLTKADRHRVMPSRFEYANADGLSPTAGFIELDGKTPGQFATLILERLALNEGKPRDHYTKPAPTIASSPRISIPHNLPALQPFFGREEELRKIADALDAESRTWGALIDGPGGMGKTSLAVRAAYDAPPGAFEKIVFVSLKSRELDDEGVRDLSGFLISGLAELLNEVARELGHAEIAKAPDDQRPRLLLDALRGTRTLLVLDNLESLLKVERDTVFTFVEKLPLGCKAILTSRRRIGSGAKELILGSLSESAALATLAKLAESNPALAKSGEDERLALYRDASGNPLLLRWTAGQVGRGGSLTLRDAVAHLRSCPEGNDPLEFIFGDLVEDFSHDETHVLCALTHFTLSAKVEQIADVAGCAVTDADRPLRSLTNRSLVVPSEELKTFTLVPLVGDFLRKKKPGVVEETGDRLGERVYAIAVENGYDQHERYPVLDAAWPTVAAALPRFLAGPNDRLQTMCDALANFLEFTGRWDERLALSKDAERLAVASGDLEKAGWRAYDAGWVHFLRGQPANVLDCASRAEAHWRKAQSGVTERAYAIKLRGHGHSLANNPADAIAAYRELVELQRSRGGESRLLAIGLNSLANVEREVGDFHSAERDYQQALRIARSIDDRESTVTIHGNLAALAISRQNWVAAEALAREALLLAENLGRQQLIASNCHRVAEALVRQGKKAEALRHARRAVELFTRLGSANLAEARNTLTECEG
jgi:tetratricopeptide (TPR) repeat protein